MDILSKAAEKDGNKRELSYEELTDALRKTADKVSVAKNENSIKLILLISKIKEEIGETKLSGTSRFIDTKVVKNLFDDNLHNTSSSTNNDILKKLVFVFYTINEDTGAFELKKDEFGNTLEELRKLINFIPFKVDSATSQKINKLSDVKKFDLKAPEGDDELSTQAYYTRAAARNKYLNTLKNDKRLQDRKKELQSDDFERTEDAIKNDEKGEFFDYLYGLDIEVPKKFEPDGVQVIENFIKKLNHVAERKLFEITDKLAAKGMGHIHSQARKKNENSGALWREELIDEGISNKLAIAKDKIGNAVRDLNPARGWNDLKATSNKDGVYRSGAEDRADEIQKRYVQQIKRITKEAEEKANKCIRQSFSKRLATKLSKEAEARYILNDAIHQVGEIINRAKKETEENGLAKLKSEVRDFVKGDNEDYLEAQRQMNFNKEAEQLITLMKEKNPNEISKIAQLVVAKFLFEDSEESSPNEISLKINSGNISEAGLGIRSACDTTQSSINDQRQKVDYTSLPKITSIKKLMAQAGVSKINGSILAETKKQILSLKDSYLKQLEEFKQATSDINSVLNKNSSTITEMIAFMLKKNGFVLKEDALDDADSGSSYAQQSNQPQNNAQQQAQTQNNNKYLSNIKDLDGKLKKAKEICLNVLRTGTNITSIIDKYNVKGNSLSDLAFRQLISDYVLLTGNNVGGKQMTVLLTKKNAEVFKKAKAEEIELENQLKNRNQNVNSAYEDEDQEQRLNDIRGQAGASVVTTAAADTTYGDGYNYQKNKNPMNRMKEIVYKSGKYTVKTRQMI